MTTTPNHTEQLDLLVSRIAGGEASADDWTAFNALAAHTPEAWKSLAQAQRDQHSLSLAVGVALHAADHVDLPGRDAADALFQRGRWRQDASHSPAWARARSMGGWAVAAALALAFLGNRFGVINIQDSPGPSNTASVIPANYFPINNPDDALALYRTQGRQSGRVIAEMPVLLDSRPATTGRGFEVVYVRQILERAQVNDLYRFTKDEANRPIPVRISVPDQPTRAE
ncbi:MAG TPA: hypothetical protein PKE29_14720 [Phycisphaerales bacterium]|nr:hypothetical protein [Phycisphaerales bacterium]